MKCLKNDWDLLDIYYVSISFLGILFLILMILWIPPSKIMLSYQKTLILSVFFIICLSGMIAAIYPLPCSQLFLKEIDKNKKVTSNYRINSKKKNNSNGKANSNYLNNSNGTINSNKSNNSMKFEGHHPVCFEFNSHTFFWRGKTYCAGCNGLMIGAVLAMTGTVIYYFYGAIPAEMSLILLAVGLGAVFISLLQIIFLKVQNNLIKLLSNLILVIGSFFILIGIDSTTGSMYIELYFIILIFFWILARIKFSAADHENICRHCNHTCPLEKE